MVHNNISAKRQLKPPLKSPRIKGMTTKEVSELTGLAISTITKYAGILGVAYYGEGRRKVYDWKKADVDRLKKAYKGKTGRPKNPEK